MNAKNIFYVLTCISFCLILGAATYEHIAVWPNAYSEPPRSLTMFQGPYALESAPFWMWVHPVTLLLFLATLGLNWRTEKKKYILLPLAVYFLVLATTFIYFVPELMSLTHTPMPIRSMFLFRNGPAAGPPSAWSGQPFCMFLPFCC